MSNDKLTTLSQQFEHIIESIGEDVTRPGLVDTPQRAAKAFQFLTNGYHENIHDLINNALFESTTSEMVIIKNIEFYSLCEHHLLPFFGRCHIAYIPNGKVLGLSKFARIVDHFARRLQIQEELTQQIANCILENTNATGVGVITEAKHLCMMMRGVGKQESNMTTSAMLKSFRKDERTRNEFLQLIRG